MNRICTDLEQSKKLIELGIDVNTADMYYPYSDRACIGKYALPVEWKIGLPLLSQEIPAWSLSALLDVLPTLNGRNAILCKDIKCDKWHVCYHSTATLSIIDTERYDNAVDACYELMLKLHELKML